MNQKRIYLGLLSLLFFISLPLITFAEVQVSFTKTGNTITVNMKPDQDYNDVAMSSFYATFRYLDAYGVTLTVTNSYYTPVVLEASYLDPTDSDYRLAIFGFYDGTPSNNSFTGNTEYPVFDFSITGGTGNGTFALAEDSPNYLYAYIYVEFDQGNDVTNYVDPFYSGSHGLEITTKTVGSTVWKYATEWNNWLSSAATTDWNTGSNWSNLVVPIASENVFINSGTNQPVISDDDILVNHLDLADNAEITVASDGTFTVNGSVTLGLNNLISINSTSTGTGSFIHNTSGVDGKLERHLEGWGQHTGDLKNGRGWHLLSSPVADQAIAPFQVLTDNDDFYKWSEEENTWKNRRQGGGSIVPNPAFELDFVVGRGYLVAYEDNKVQEFNGEINVDDIAVSDLTNNYVEGPLNFYGHNLIGNPFASALTWGTAAWNRSNVAAHIQIWNEASSSYTVLGVGDPIPAMQGFFVYVPELVKTETGSLTIPASERIHSDQAFYKSSQEEQILLVARDLDHELSQESRIRFNPDATDSFDMEYDAYYMAGYAPRFYSQSNNAAYALNTFPVFDEAMEIPFGFEKNDGTNFSITLEQNLEFATTYLTDNKTGVTVNLSDNPTYYFTSVEGDDINRFELKFSPVYVNVIDKEDLIDIFAFGNSVYLSSSELFGNTKVSVIDMLGREVLSTNILLEGQVSIDVSGLNGAYIIRAINDQVVVSTKVVIR
jgi:hypothetical protein